MWVMGSNSAFLMTRAQVGHPASQESAVSWYHSLSPHASAVPPASASHVCVFTSPVLRPKLGTTRNINSLSGLFPLCPLYQFVFTAGSGCGADFLVPVNTSNQNFQFMLDKESYFEAKLGWGLLWKPWSCLHLQLWFFNMFTETHGPHPSIL